MGLLNKIEIKRSSLKEGHLIKFMTGKMGIVISNRIFYQNGGFDWLYHVFDEELNVTNLSLDYLQGVQKIIDLSNKQPLWLDFKKWEDYDQQDKNIIWKDESEDKSEDELNIVITGKACSGKSSMSMYLRELLRSYGFNAEIDFFDEDESPINLYLKHAEMSEEIKNNQKRIKITTQNRVNFPDE